MLYLIIVLVPIAVLSIVFLVFVIFSRPRKAEVQTSDESQIGRRSKGEKGPTKGSSKQGKKNSKKPSALPSKKGEEEGGGHHNRSDSSLVMAEALDPGITNVGGPTSKKEKKKGKKEEDGNTSVPTQEVPHPSKGGFQLPKKRSKKKKTTPPQETTPPQPDAAGSRMTSAKQSRTTAAGAVNEMEQPQGLGTRKGGAGNRRHGGARPPNAPIQKQTGAAAGSHSNVNEKAHTAGDNVVVPSGSHAGGTNANTTGRTNVATPTSPLIKPTEAGEGPSGNVPASSTKNVSSSVQPLKSASSHDKPQGKHTPSRGTASNGGPDQKEAVTRRGGGEEDHAQKSGEEKGNAQKSGEEKGQKSGKEKEQVNKSGEEKGQKSGEEEIRDQKTSEPSAGTKPASPISMQDVGMATVQSGVAEDAMEQRTRKVNTRSSRAKPASGLAEGAGQEAGVGGKRVTPAGVSEGTNPGKPARAVRSRPAGSVGGAEDTEKATPTSNGGPLQKRGGDDTAVSPPKKRKVTPPEPAATPPAAAQGHGDAVVSGKGKKPASIEELGYRFNEDGKLRCEDDKPFKFINQAHYEELGEAITEHVYKLLELKAGLERVYLPVGTTEGKPRSFIFVSPGAFSKDKILVLIHGSGVVRAGQWARRLIINDSLDSGTQLPYIDRAKQEGYGVVVLNTNRNRDESGERIEGNDSPERHCAYVWVNFIATSKAKQIDIVAHSYGGVVTCSMAKRFRDDFESRVQRIAFTDSVHSVSSGDNFIAKHAVNWVTSSEPLDTLLDYSYSDAKRVSAGTTVHEETSWKAMESVFTYLRGEP